MSSSTATVPAATRLRPTDRVPARSFLLLAGSTTLLTTVVLLVASLARSDGHFVYALDDPAIHQSMARQLLENGTWGVSSGDFASASSSPGWTLLLAASTGLLPFARDALPLALNLGGALLVLWLLARNQRFLQMSGPGRWLAGGVIVMATVVLWFLPGLAFLGMEHSLHAALALAVVVMLDRLRDRPLTMGATWPVAVLLLVATAVRFESAFLAAGCAVAVLAGTTRRLGETDGRVWWTRPAALRSSALFVTAASVPIVVMGVVGLAFDEGFLPNSIIAKTTLEENSGVGILRAPGVALRELLTDRAVLALLLIAGGYLVWAVLRGPGRHAAIAAAFAVTVLLHIEFADFGWHERYQAYLIVAGSYVALQIAAEVVPPSRRTAVLAVALLLIPAFSTGRMSLTWETPLATSNTYRQRYQMALFLRDHYDGRGFLTGELGYTTYLHDGPVVDILGLGTHEVVEARTDRAKPLSADVVERLATEHDVEVMAFYAGNPGIEIPESWTFAGEWELREDRASVPDRFVHFYARSGPPAEELARRLVEFEPRLPSHVEFSDWAEVVERYVQATR